MTDEKKLTQHEKDHPYGTTLLARVSQIDLSACALVCFMSLFYACHTISPTILYL